MELFNKTNAFVSQKRQFDFLKPTIRLRRFVNLPAAIHQAWAAVAAVRGCGGGDEGLRRYRSLQNLPQKRPPFLASCASELPPFGRAGVGSPSLNSLPSGGLGWVSPSLNSLPSGGLGWVISASVFLLREGRGGSLPPFSSRWPPCRQCLSCPRWWRYAPCRLPRRRDGR